MANMMIAHGDHSRSVECNRIRGVWMVKIPRYLSELWEANEGQIVGTISAPPNCTDQTTLQLKSHPRLNQTYAALAERAPELSHLRQAPETHKIIINETIGQDMVVLTEDKSELREDADILTGRLRIVAKIKRKCDCRPDDDKYMRMKMEQLQKCQQPKNYIRQLDRAAVKFKPISHHAEVAVHAKLKKEGNKLVRHNVDFVRNALFKAFEKHQYYRLLDLEALLQQPAGFIKEILMEIGTYNTAFPHKNMWELKPEYRHYSAS